MHPSHGGSPKPTLRAWSGLLLAGVLSACNQPVPQKVAGFSGRLSNEEVEAIHAYLIKRSHDLKDEMESTQ